MTKSKLWMAAVLAAAVMGGCKPGPGTHDEQAHATPVRREAEPTGVAAAAGDTAAPAAEAGAAAGAPAEPGTADKNPLAFNLPTIDKTVATWKHGLKRPDPFPVKFDPKKDYFATLHTTKGDVTVKFFPELAPKHVTSFLYLSEVGYYDDAPFHRVCRGFMMQGGDPTGRGTGGPGYTVPAEFNARKHVKGILSAARTPDPDSAGSQFFLMFTAYPSLDNQYSVFGQVDGGMDIVEKFEKEVAVASRPDMSCPPRSLEKIKNVTVFTKEKK